MTARITVSGIVTCPNCGYIWHFTKPPRIHKIRCPNSPCRKYYAVGLMLSPIEAGGGTPDGPPVDTLFIGPIRKRGGPVNLYRPSE